MVERRKARRVKVKDRAMMVHGTSMGAIGQVIDIGDGGMAFYYIGHPNRLDEILKLSIRQEDQTIQLNNVHVKTVTDFEIIYDNPIQQIPLRRRGVRFGILSEQQIKQLDFFISMQQADEIRSFSENAAFNLST